VCAQAALLPSLPQPVSVSVNISGLQFIRPDFVETVAAALKEYGLRASCLELELTETVVMRDVDNSAAKIARLRELGISIAIDDFGTGYSSLGYLQRLPIDVIKIDQSFVADIGIRATALPLIEALVAMAHRLGIRVIVEGVETQEQLEAVTRAGCDAAQGYLLGRPALAIDAPTWSLAEPVGL
jgi:EAL domain-containing protein (putative c-di-GMP-specific phosphodiesterase class I)